tara:strand:- start:11742 stop:12245 length:504 start_codon:yes stop_codon:yes gene_type:complete
MKLLKSLFVLFVAVSIISCSSDDSNQYTLNNANLSGTHSITMLNSSETETTNVNGLDIVTVSTTVGDTFQVIIVFSEDGTYAINGEYRIGYVTTVAGQIVNEGFEIIDFTNETGNYTTNDSLMEIEFDGETYDVTLFNANELRMVTQNIYTNNGIDHLDVFEMRMTR